MQKILVEMEELLQDIFREASGPKFASLKKSCQDALEVLCLQDSANKPSWEVRRACLVPLQMSLESKKPKLVNYSINGFYKILRDDRFHRGIEPEDDSLWLPSQLLCATASVMYQQADTQVQIFRMYLSLALSPRRTLNGRLCVWACGRCAEAAASTPPVAAAARAAAAQTLRAYCSQLDEECQELMSDRSPLGKNHLAAVGCYSEVIPVIQYLCGRLAETQLIPKQNQTSLFFLDCLLTLMSSLSERVGDNPHFTTFLWQKFCPSLISFLGTPKIDKNIKSREHEGHSVDDSGRGSGALGCAPSFNSRQAKTVYSIANQLVRLVGSKSTLRPVLEALYHRMLLYPPVTHRVEALRSTKEILSNPRRLRQLLLATSDQESHSDDMAIIRLIMDGIEECGRSGNPTTTAAAVECVVSLLDALEKMCSDSEEHFSPTTAAVILQHWPKLQDSDYSGPLTYQTLARLPSPYRDVVAVLQCAEEKENDSSDTSGPENISSCSEGEADSDADNVFLPSRVNDPNSTPHNTEGDSPIKKNFKSIPKTLNLGRCNITECNVDLERHNARQFVKTLQFSMLPKLLNLRTCIEVDEALQDFASKCCQHNAAQPPSTACIMNADGIYLATYAALLLTLKLRKNNYYIDPSKASLPLTEDGFVDEVQGSGVLVYLSATWLRELYQQVLARDLLKDAEHSEYALMHLLSDMGGLDQSPVMSDWQKLKEVSMLYQNTNDSSEKQANLRWARRILTCIWDSMVMVLSVPLTGYKNRKQKIQGIISKKINTIGKRNKMAWEGLTIQCLEGLHKAAQVSNTLNLQNRCSHILGLLANSAISQPPNGKILSTHALSLDILISGGLELGPKAPECWEHIFAACQYVSQLEHSLFGQQNNHNSSVLTIQTVRNKTVSIIHADKRSFEGQDDEQCVDVFNFLQPAFGNNISNDMSVPKIVEACRQESGNIITGSGAARVCCALASAADTLYTRLAATTTLPTLKAALQRLVKYQHRLLFSGFDQDLANNNIRWWRRNDGQGTGVGAAARALCRTGDVALRCFRATRPLAHRMSIWTVVGPHFMQAACHKDIQISSLGIQCLHDCATTLLNQQEELPHFHFNEALLKPFENLLCLELCDDDIQEQIISCICEFVETNRMEIRSGWRPLFNTLRAANNANQYSAILEIFKVFLSTDNTLVFANAALDCILCLLSHIKGLHYDDVQSTEIKSQKKISTPTKPKPSLSLKFAKNSKFIPLNEEKSEKAIINMCKEALFHLENCADILTMMYNMPKCPVFNTGNRIKGDLPLSVVDPIIPSACLDITKYISNVNYEEELITYKKLSTSLPPTNTANNCLLKLDRPSNILKVWYVLIEGLISATVVCSKKNQPAAMETLFKVLKNAIEVPGTHFGLHCINHLLLPMVQNWLRQISNVSVMWDTVMPNFKQCCGMTTDIIVVYLHNLQQINSQQTNSDDQDEEFECIEITFAIKQIMLILVECVAQPQETIARLGASCIRHIILTSGYLLTDNQWELVAISLHRACNVSLTPMKQLSYAFKENSNSFYGDMAIVKVAARRDCSVNDNVRLHAMAQQVFLTEHVKPERREPKLTAKNSSQNLMLMDDRSYVFLIYLQESINSLNPDLYTIRLPHRGLVVGLLAHQILVQIIATILIQASSDVFHDINCILFENLKNNSNCENHKIILSVSNVDLLLKSLEMSYMRAMHFDSRPGLKFLVQKVSNLDYAANLYKQTTSSWLIKIIALTEIFFKGGHKFRLKPNDIDIILQKYTTSINLTLDYDQFVKKIFDLKTSWELLCNNYMKHLIQVSDFDEAKNNSERVSCSSIDTDSSSNHENDYDATEITVTVCIENNKYQDEIEKPKPFTFKDFKTNCQSSNDEIKIIADVENITEKSTMEMEYVTSSNSNSITDEKDILHSTKEILHFDKKISNNEKNEIKKFSFNDNSKVNSTPRTINNVNNKVNSPSKTVNIAISDGPNLNNNIEPIIPPQPIPPEIEQQRALSITKDLEVQRNCFQNILMAYLELVLTFPLERFQLIYPVLQEGFIQLSKNVTEPNVLERINLFFSK